MYTHISHLFPQHASTTNLSTASVQLNDVLHYALDLQAEQHRAPAHFVNLFTSSTSPMVCINVYKNPDPVKIREDVVPGTIVRLMEQAFEPSVEALGKMLGVTRQMISAYKRGQSEKTESEKGQRRNPVKGVTFSRMQVFMRLYDEVLKGVQQPVPLDTPLADGSTLLDLLIQDHIEYPVVRQCVAAIVSTIEDRKNRTTFAHALVSGFSDDSRSDIAMEYQAQGEPRYEGHPTLPGKVIRVDPDGKRTVGHVVKRQFIADES